MNQRVNISILLLSLSLIMAFLPGVGKYSFIVDQEELVESLAADDLSFSVDQVAAFIVSEDSSVQLIDLRQLEDYNKFNIPGSLNVPFMDFFSSKPETWLYNPDIKYIFYSNSDVYSSEAVVLARGLGYQNCYAMSGGLNMWYETVMNSSFTGERISARQNRLFENRLKAKRFFNDINSLPDSLRLKYAESRRQAERDLDGGCE